MIPPVARLRDTLANWLDERTGIRELRHRVLGEPLPAGTGWWFTLGGLVLFGLFVQVITGIGLALFYVPAADQAWDSIRFVETRVRGGAFLRGLHYWGRASSLSRRGCTWRGSRSPAAIAARAR
jgi:quinol-cytochrome oxidoreductase complex cytochrome b subunit